MSRFNIHHVTRYTYEEPVRDSANQVILFPIRDEYQEPISQELTITGEPVVEIYKDYYGNEVGSFSYAEPHRELVIDSRVEVEVKSKPLPDDMAPAEEQWLHLLQAKQVVPYLDFTRLEPFPSIEEARKIINGLDTGKLTPLQAAKILNEYVYKNFGYDKGVTDVETTLEEVWKLKAGVCQDFAHVLLIMLRMINIPARYVSGYICPNKNGMRGEGATHAWVEAYIPYYGWLGFDPTNNSLASHLHVRLAVGRSFSDVSPVKGTYKGTSRHVLEVGVTVSYENGEKPEEQLAVLVAQPSKNSPPPGTSNSYRRHLEMMQMQQQQ
ncbi:MAG TPA: transglutaminase family protein [Chitinophagaceae bacterium]|jgi:transglutaminase-like putative cysteine protease